MKWLWAWRKANQGFEWANAVHKNLFTFVVVTLAILLAIAVTANVFGAGMVNTVVAIVAYVIGAFFATKPTYVAAMFAGGATVNGLPNFSIGKLLTEGPKALPDFDLKAFVVAGYDAVKVYVKGMAHAFNIVGATAILLVYLPLKEEPAAALLLLAVAMGFGIYALLFAEKFVWLERFTRFTLLGGLAVAALLLVPIQFWIAFGANASWFTPQKERETAASLLVNMETVRGAEVDQALLPVARVVENGTRLNDKQIDDALAALKKAAPSQKENALVAQAEKTVRSGTVAQSVREFFRGKQMDYVIQENLVLPPFTLPPGTYDWDIVGDPKLTTKIPETELVGIKKGHTVEGAPLPTYNAFGLLLNGTPRGKELVVGEDGTVTVTINIPDRYATKYASGQWKADPLLVQFIFR